MITHVEKGVIADQFYAERLYNRESLEHLLRGAGFGNITVHCSLCPDSQRNQDLGMMERRIIVTASIKKDWTPVRRRPQGLAEECRGADGRPEQAGPPQALLRVRR